MGSGIVDILPLETLTAEFGPESTTNEVSQQSQGGAKVARFAFPDYEDRTNAQEVANRHSLMQRTGASSSPGYNRHDVYLEQAFSPPENGSVPALPSYHVFSHRLANGLVIHGHVRKYLRPIDGTCRRDVGRRSVRALVILTRNSGGGIRLYNALLKTLEVLKYSPGDNDRKWFLHSLFQEHVNLCREVSSSIPSSGNSSLTKPRIITLPLVEAGRGHGLFGTVDSIKFACPPSFLHEREPSAHDYIFGFSRNDMMPMLRCLGVVRTMRLLSALLSEKRIIFTSANVAKLSAVGYGAVSMLSQGMLPSPSVFVPVLPPGLASLLSTPSAYLIGVLKGATPNFIDLRSMVPKLGELVIFDLDSVGNEPFFVGITNPNVSVPDLTRRSFEDVGDSSLNGMSLPDMLYQDLAEVIKTDKKQMFWQGAVQEKLGMAAEKGKAAAKNAMKKGLKYLKDKKRSMDGKDVKEEDEIEGDDVEKPENGNSLTKLVGKGNYFYEQGFPNAAAEAEACIAFSTFFVSLFGDLRAYLTQSTPGTPPVADRDKFMKHRANNGDLPGSSMYNLLYAFLRTSLFNQFVDARLAEVQMRRPVPEDAPLFALTTNYHRSNKIDFAANNIRQSTRHLISNVPGNFLVAWNEGIRRRVSDLTSTQAFNGDPRKALALLTEDCHESSCILIDTVMILWTRMQEGKGMQWRKALLALQIFRDLLLNGPISALAEAFDGFASIRIMKSYAEAMRGHSSSLVRAAALDVYNLAVNLPALFAARRECLNSQRKIKDPRPSPLRKETRMIKGITQFRNVHIALRPAGATVAPAPPLPNASTNDLLGQDSTPRNSSTDVTQSANYSSDLLSLGLEAVSTDGKKMSNPFDTATMSNSLPEASPITNETAENHSVNHNIPQEPMQPISITAASSSAYKLNSSQQPLDGGVTHQFPHHITQQGQQQFSAPQMQHTHQQTQQLINQPGIIHSSPPPIQTQPQQQHMTQIYPNQHPHMQHNQPPQHQQQWNSAVQQVPQGFGNTMMPPGGARSAMQPPQFQQPQQPPQQQQQSSKPNFSMFDPMAK